MTQSPTILSLEDSDKFGETWGVANILPTGNEGFVCFDNFLLVKMPPATKSIYAKIHRDFFMVEINVPALLIGGIPQQEGLFDGEYFIYSYTKKGRSIEIIPYGLSNVQSSGAICFGDSTPKTLLDIYTTFWESTFKPDYLVKDPIWKEKHKNCNIDHLCRDQCSHQHFDKSDLCECSKRLPDDELRHRCKNCFGYISSDKVTYLIEKVSDIFCPCCMDICKCECSCSCCRNKCQCNCGCSFETEDYKIFLKNYTPEWEENQKKVIDHYYEYDKPISSVFIPGHKLIRKIEEYVSWKETPRAFPLKQKGDTLLMKIHDDLLVKIEPKAK